MSATGRRRQNAGWSSYCQAGATCVSLIARSVSLRWRLAMAERVPLDPQPVPTLPRLQTVDGLDWVYARGWRWRDCWWADGEDASVVLVHAPDGATGVVLVDGVWCWVIGGADG